MRWRLAIGALFVLVLLGSGCGAGGDHRAASQGGVTAAKHRAPTSAEARDITSTISSLQGAMARGDAAAVCRLYTEVARQTETDLYATCATGVRSDLRREKPPRLSVGKIEISFDPSKRPRLLEASAAVTSSAAGRRPFEMDAVLVLERGSWRVDDNAIDYLVKPQADSASGGE
jgi:hypothetical protein